MVKRRNKMCLTQYIIVSTVANGLSTPNLCTCLKKNLLTF